MNIFGMDARELAEQYGTPLYVMDEEEIRNRLHETREWKMSGSIAEGAYASKAFLTKDMVRLVDEYDLALDCVSGGELYVAKSAGFPMGKVIFHGNGKTLEELYKAMEYGVGLIVVDNEWELKKLEVLAKDLQFIPRILFRTIPGVKADTHDFIMTGQQDSKFGIAMGEDLSHMVEYALNSPHLNFAGLHYHIGSQIHEVEPYMEAAKLMMEELIRLRTRFRIEIDILNMGGGFGITDGEGGERQPLSTYLKPVVNYIAKECEERFYEMPDLIIEPGRWVVGEAGMTLYDVVAVKYRNVGRSIVIVDGGMSDNIRPALYDAEYEAMVEYEDRPQSPVSVVGKLCESGDILIEETVMPLPQPGDLLAIKNTGAYNFSMSSRYNMMRRPAVVMVRNGEARLSVRRESFEDLVDHMV